MVAHLPCSSKVGAIRTQLSADVKKKVDRKNVDGKQANGKECRGRKRVSGKPWRPGEGGQGEGKRKPVVDSGKKMAISMPSFDIILSGPGAEISLPEPPPHGQNLLRKTGLAAYVLWSGVRWTLEMVGHLRSSF